MTDEDFKKLKNGDIIYCELIEPSYEAQWIAVLKKIRGDNPKRYHEYCYVVKNREGKYRVLVNLSDGCSMASEIRLATKEERKIMIDILKNDGRKSAEKILRIIARNEKKRAPEEEQTVPEQASVQPVPEAPDQTEAPDKLSKEGDPVKMDDEVIYNIPEGYEFKGIENGQVILKKKQNVYNLSCYVNIQVTASDIEEAMGMTDEILCEGVVDVFSKSGKKIAVVKTGIIDVWIGQDRTNAN